MSTHSANHDLTERDPEDAPDRDSAGDYLIAAWREVRTLPAFSDMRLPEGEFLQEEGEVYGSQTATLYGLFGIGRDGAIEYAAAMERYWSAVRMAVRGMR